MVAQSSKTKKFIYRQGLANLRLEGMTLEAQQHRMVLEYQNGKLSHRELIDKALAYARSR